MLLKLSFVFHDLTRTMNWVQDETLLIPLADVENFTTDQWNAAYAKLEADVNARKRPTLGSFINTPEPLQAPTVVQQTQQVQTPPPAQPNRLNLT